MTDYKELIEELRMVASCGIGECYDCSQCVKSATAIETLLAERDAAINLLRKINWCCGCAHFNGLKGCGKNVMDICCEKNDYYQFCGAKMDLPEGGE